MLNAVLAFVVFVSVLLAAQSGRMPELTASVFESAEKAVTLALGLVGAMAFFLGLMKVGQDAGLLRIIARAVAPVMRRLFPSVPAEHPAMGAMIMNIACNALGLGNAATPFGIKAIEQLDTLNGAKGTATNAMVLFLAINTSGLALLPTGVMTFRAAAGSTNPAAIWFPTWIASSSATLVGVLAALLLARLPRYRATEPPATRGGASAGGSEAEVGEPVGGPAPVLSRRVALWLFWAAFFVFAATDFLDQPAAAAARGFAGWLRRFFEWFTPWVVPALVAGLLLFGWSRGVRIYDSLVEGAKEGFQVAIRIIPFLVAILVAVGMFRASGAMAWFVRALEPVTSAIGMPAEALPMAILRPLSGSGASGYMVETMAAHGPDSHVGLMVSTIQGSTETTFYVLAVYFGAVGIRRTRHALPACLAADVAGIAMATVSVNLLLG